LILTLKIHFGQSTVGLLRLPMIAVSLPGDFCITRARKSNYYCKEVQKMTTLINLPEK